MGLKEFQQDNNELLNFILTERFFKNWKLPPATITNKSGQIIGGADISSVSSSNLELFLTSHCNQSCEYCYLYKYENELYPKAINTSEKILKNLKIILQWIVDNNFDIRTIDLFTGEIWHSQFGLDVLDTILFYLDKGLKTNNFIIPSNMSFLWDEDQMCKIQNRLDDARKKYGARFCFSASVDGKYCEGGRPQKDGKVKDDEFYERLFLFCQHNQFFFHPMISANNVFYWKDNYQWWKEKCHEYNFIFRKAVMPLDVRNDDWTEEAIQARVDLEEYIIEDYFADECKSDPDEFRKHCFPSCDRTIEADGYMSPALNFAYSFPGCTVADTLSVRVGDLAIIPCHRTAYDKFIYGYFDVEDDKIIGIKGANNVHMAIKVLFMNNKNTTYDCDICKYADYCYKGCYGSQFEYNKDPFIPNKSVCEMVKRKIDKIVEIYEKYGVIDKIKELTEYDEEYQRVKHFLKFYKNIKKKENIYDKLS